MRHKQLDMRKITGRSSIKSDECKRQAKGANMVSEQLWQKALTALISDLAHTASAAPLAHVKRLPLFRRRHVESWYVLEQGN
jgi:hypothetical protein